MTKFRRCQGTVADLAPDHKIHNLFLNTNDLTEASGSAAAETTKPAKWRASMQRDVRDYFLIVVPPLPWITASTAPVFDFTSG